MEKTGAFINREEKQEYNLKVLKLTTEVLSTLSTSRELEGVRVDVVAIGWG